jgi:2-polyprenyl-6-methoxyphenol hydroxylase-like FAD-dependent oxidoreductase
VVPHTQLVALTVGIVGAGIGGVTAALALHQRGHTVQVFERSPELGEVGAAVSLWSNALAALDRLGLEQRVRAHGQWETQLGILSPSGRRLLVSEANTNLMIARPALHRVLREATGEIPIRLGARCVAVTSSPSAASIHLDDGSAFQFDVVLGADGIHSTVRAALAPDHEPLRYSGSTAWRAVLHAPQLRDNAASLTIGRGLQFLITPLPDGQVYWSPLTLPAERVAGITEHLGFLTERFGAWHDPIPELLYCTPREACFPTPVYFRRPPAWLHRGPVVLIGDAAHPMTPDLGQGACQAIEDAVVLAECLSSPGSSPEQALEEFTRRRLPRIRAIVRLARQMGKLYASANPLVEALRTTMLRSMPSSVLNRAATEMTSRHAFDRQLD